MLVAPSEPKSLRTLGTYSPLPESFGVDFLIPCPVGLVGVQRKEVHDLIASRSDGRLARELAQMKQLDVGILLVEGRLKWTSDGLLLTSHTKWTRAMHHGLVLSILSQGVWVISSESLQESRELLSLTESWMMKETHKGINIRPKPITKWGMLTDRDFAIHFIQGLDGIGPGVAGAIFERFGFPFALTLTREQLQSVEGIGPKRAEKIWKLFNSQ